MARDVNVGPTAEKKLERYGVWVKVEPRDVTRGMGGSNELADLEPAAEGRSSFTAEEENLLDDLETGVGHEVEAGTQGELESLDERLSSSSLDEELPELEDAVEVPLTDGKPGTGRFDDLESIEGQIGPPSGTARQPEILSRIERELRSIRSDLATLKKELADLRRPRAAAAPSDAAAEPKAGFFEEEEDDTIALTGDELDNILNTADITEAAAEEAAEEPAAEAEEIVPFEGSETAPDLAAEPVEELEEVTDLDLELPDTAPAELVLEGAGDTPEPSGELPELELEGIPELEASEAELEELPADEGTVADADLVADLEELPPESEAKAGTAIPEVDLKALHETQESGDESILSTDDLGASDLAELEAVTEEPAPAAGSSIEIDFEPAADAEEVESLEAVEDLEEVAEVLEEAPREAAPVGAPEPPRPAARPETAAAAGPALAMSESLKKDLRNVLSVIDELLDALPEKKIREFAKSEHFAVYKKLFEDLGLSSE